MSETPEERAKRINEDIAKSYDAHCFFCGKRLNYEKMYFVCPTHGKNWYPIQGAK